ncbi:MAG: polysaccharide pyruvyl transferase family protein [Roseburia sp.]|nr:polysaccharide pyruvyl transferase family protein [Roseburia sp.]
MRYANLVCDDIFTIKGTSENDNIERLWNVGDYIQVLAIENLYKEMGMKSEDIVRIRMQELKTYKGEKLLLPINLIVYGDNFFDGSDMVISEDIVPVFLGVHFYHYFFSEKTKQYLREYGPVGCRDESVLMKLQALNIPAYLSGCVTITLPKRKQKPSKGKVYLVDVPEALYEYFPEWIKENMVETTSVYFMSKTNMLQGKTMKEFVEEKYREYFENASLVITSRLHVASPCIAAGIPVILARESITGRFAWLDKFIRIYTPENFSEIDWEINAVEMNEEKRKIIDADIAMIRSQYTKYSAIEKIGELYEKRNRCVYQDSSYLNIEPIIEYMNENWNSESEEMYAIWGWSVYAEEVIKYIESHYPKAKLVMLFDSYRSFEKYGITAQPPTGLKNNKDYITFITSDAVGYIAEEYFREHAYNANGYVLMGCGANSKYGFGNE